MKVSILLFLSFFCLKLSGQGVNDSTTKSFNKFWSVGVNFSADYCYRTLDNGDGSAMSDIIISSRDEYEIPKFGYTTGLTVCYHISELFSVEGGLQYSNKGYDFDEEAVAIDFGDMIDPRYGFVYIPNPNPVVSWDFYNNAIYLDVPVRANFSFGKRKIKFIGSAGFTTNILLEADHVSILEYKNGDVKKKRYSEKQYYKPLNLSPFVSIGVDYSLSKRFNLRLEPVFRYGLFHITDTPVTGYLWNAGLNFSCYYNFKRPD